MRCQIIVQHAENSFSIRKIDLSMNEFHTTVTVLNDVFSSSDAVNWLINYQLNIRSFVKEQPVDIWNNQRAASTGAWSLTHNERVPQKFLDPKDTAEYRVLFQPMLQKLPITHIAIKLMERMPWEDVQKRMEAYNFVYDMKEKQWTVLFGPTTEYDTSVRVSIDVFNALSTILRKPSDPLTHLTIFFESKNKAIRFLEDLEVLFPSEACLAIRNNKLFDGWTWQMSMWDELEALIVSARLKNQLDHFMDGSVSKKRKI